MIRSTILLSLTVILPYFQSERNSFSAFRMETRVVTYSTGKINTNTYEGLSFWIKDNKRAYIRYAHGKDAEDLDLAYAGLVQVNGEKGFCARFPAPDTGTFRIFQRGYG